MRANDKPRETSPPRAYDMTRRARGAEGTRRRIAAAALALYKERDFDDVSLNDIARAAGVSHQTVLNHCESKSGVLLAASEVFREEVEAFEADAVPGDVASVVHATCARYELFGDANVRWGAMSARSPEVAEALAMGMRHLQAWLREMFAGSIPGDDEPDEQQRVVFGLHAALDVFTWKLMRRDLGLSQAQTEQQLTDLVLGVLARHRI